MLMSGQIWSGYYSTYRPSYTVDKTHTINGKMQIQVNGTTFELPRRPKAPLVVWFNSVSARSAPAARRRQRAGASSSAPDGSENAVELSRTRGTSRRHGLWSS
jgi:hypothetical protein